MAEKGEILERDKDYDPRIKAMIEERLADVKDPHFMPKDFPADWRSDNKNSSYNAQKDIASHAVSVRLPTTRAAVNKLAQAREDRIISDREAKQVLERAAKETRERNLAWKKVMTPVAPGLFLAYELRQRNKLKEDGSLPRAKGVIGVVYAKRVGNGYVYKPYLRSRKNGKTQYVSAIKSKDGLGTRAYEKAKNACSMVQKVYCSGVVAEYYLNLMREKRKEYELQRDQLRGQTKEHDLTKDVNRDIEKTRELKI